MLKGATIKDDDAGWAGVKLRDGATLLMMGSKEEDIPSRPQEKTKFVEDMDESELQSALDMPAGLQGRNSIDTLNFGRKTGHQTGPHSGSNSVLGY